MTCHLLVEGEADAALAKAILKREIAKVPLEVWVGGGKGGADSLARSLLVARHEPVLVLLDADTTDRESISEQRRSFESSLGQVSDPRLFAVHLAVPALEKCYFDIRGLTEELFGEKLSPRDEVRAEFEPKQLLDELRGRRHRAMRRSIPSMLRASHVDKMRQLPLFQDLLAKIKELTAAHDKVVV